MCAGAIYKFKGQPQVVLPESGDAKEDRQIAIPFVDQGSGQTAGYLLISRDRTFLGDVICKTFLSPDHWQIKTNLVAALPEWYIHFVQQQAERERAGLTALRRPHGLYPGVHPSDDAPEDHQTSQ
jgi:hypothetical protein